MHHFVLTARAVACLLAMAGAALPVAAHETASKSERLGAVHFKVECNAAAQKEVSRWRTTTPSPGRT
jgi:hypothetical protein